MELLQRRAGRQAADRAFVFLDGEHGEDVRYAELDSAARRVAAALSARGVAGEPVLLLYPPGRAYVEGFLGCLYAGAIAVPAYPPDPLRLARTLPRLRALLADCGARLALTVSGLADAVPALVAGAPELGALDWIATDGLPDDPSWTPRCPSGDAPALLQYTSGSTGEPKGVVISHANLVHNAELVHLGFGTSPDDVGVIWLPPYHDMGLIGGIVQPIYAGLPAVLMSPLAFLQRPMSWLEAISRYGATISGGPNFAYELCVRKSTPSQRASLDLSRWAVAFCGAEPVRADTLERFAAAFACAGFRHEAFYPCYGLAEATLIVTGGRRDEPPRLVRPHVACGPALGDQQVVVADPETGTACPPGTAGEIWVSGPSVARGYWNRPEESALTFGARLAGDPRHYLRTGDLGLLDRAGELVVTGRAKDLIIIRGRNLHPQDLEHAVEQRVAAVRPGCSAAFGVELDGEERVAIACEVVFGDVDTADTVAAIRGVLAEDAEVNPGAVVLLRPRTIPKTSSGKIRRHACRQAFLDGTWDADGAEVVARWDRRGVAFEQPAVAAGVVERIALVLGLDPHEIPVDAPLTRLGLDSVQAVELRERLGLDVPISELLTGITVAELTTRAATRVQRAAESTLSPLNAEAAGHGVSDGQRALWFLQRWAPDAGAYEITRAVRICSALDPDALERALRVLVRRHPALRTCLPSEGGEPVARVFDWDGPVLRRHDVAALDEDALHRLVLRDARQRFDLERGPLLRVSLYTRGPADHVLLFSLHHLITDFWSLSVLADELLALYAGGAPDLPEPPPAFRDDVTSWRIERGNSTSSTPPQARSTAPGTGSAALEARLDWWRANLGGAPDALELPTAFPRPRVQSFRGATHDFRIEPAMLCRLDALARQAGTTRFVTLLAAFAALLARYAGEDVVIGTPHRADARAVGYFVNPVPLRIRVEPDAPFHALVEQARRVLLGALEHAVPFPRLVEAVRPVRDPARSPVMQVMLTLQQAPPGRPDLGAFAVEDDTASVKLGGLDVRPYRLGDDGAAFDVSLMLAEVGGGLTGALEYCTDLFDEPAIARLARQFTTLLAGAVTEPDRPVATIELMDGAERAAVLALADGGPPHAEPATLHALFERQAARRPDAAAVVCGDRMLTYAELDRRANRLAALLRGRFGVCRGGVVGVCLPRHEDAVVAFWAVLKAGGAYLPLEPELPRRRLAWMIDDARPQMLLTHTTIADRLPAGGPPRCHLDELDDPDRHAGVPQSAPRASGRPHADDERLGAEEAGPDDLAYIIYTSGSTGRPKGVLVPHRGAPHIARAEAAALGFTEHDRMLQYASCAYDVSIAEIDLSQLHGAVLVLTPPEATVPGRELARLLAEQRITALGTSPSVLAALPDADLPDLTRLIVGGEACPVEVVSRWAPGRRLVNGYGPTEITIGATLGACRADGARPPIGRPIPGTRTYVLDERMAPVPVGVPGELCVAGAGLAWGYLGRPGLTAERFVPDPFGTGERLYRTGDLARWLPDGDLDFLGRLDDQVQLHGVRVEPGEIESRLRELLALREVAVVPRRSPGGDLELVAYLVADGSRPPVAELRALLRAELPAPWVPSAFVYLDALPLNTSHKLDRRALPAPTPADRGVAGRLAPRTELERTVARVWASVLGIAEVGVRDHFFDQLGGTSLLITKITSELGDRLGVEVPVTHLFEHPTVEALARRLDEDRAAATDDAPGRRVTAQWAAERTDRPSDSEGEVAVIGMAGAFPGAPDLGTFWRNLRDGVESIYFFGEDELEPSPFVPREHPGFVPAGGVLDQAELFDHELFGIARREACWMDPQQRVFLQLAWAALEDAGHDPARFGGRISVYAGAGNSGHLLALLGQDGLDPASLYEAIGGASAENLATRVSFLLRLRGESMNVHTACSTGLAAVHMACQSLLHGRSDLALAGAVSISVPQRTGYLHQEGMILSPDGHCRAFDARAAGTVPGHGAGVVVLRPLADALAAGDRIYAVIESTAINNEGHRSVGYTAPSVAAQAEVVADALDRAGVTGDDIGYVEAHGTGTPLGDPIEVAALTRAFRRNTDRVADCPIGSVKTNIGHLDTAAGIAGLIKTVLMLEHGEIPPSLHFEQPNPAIAFADSPFHVNTDPRPWKGNGGPRRAGVSSFGIGGTNVHAVLAEPPTVADSPASTRPHQLVTLAAHTPSALSAVATELADRLAGSDLALADVAYTRAVGRVPLRYRRSFVAADPAELVDALRGAAADGQPVAGEPRVALLFPGQGAAWHGMAAELYGAESAFRDELDRCLVEIEPRLHRPLLPTLLAGDGPIDDPELAHAALFAVEVALARVWMGWGIRPAALLGHSFGEYAAACVAGVFSLADAASLAVTRGRLVATLPPGGMLAVGLSEGELAPYLQGSGLSLAAVNGGGSCVVSGPAGELAGLRARLTADGHSTVPLHGVRHAFHSAAVEPVLAGLRAAADRCHTAAPVLPLMSTLTGAWWSGDDGRPGYWARQMREPVRFADALATLATAGAPLVLVEVGADQTLTSLARSELGERALVLPSLRHRRRGTGSDHRVLLEAVGGLWCAGAPVDWDAFYRGERRRRVSLPSYPFEGADCRLAPAPASPVAAAPDLIRVPRVQRAERALPAPETTFSPPNAGERDDEGPADDLERKVFEIWAERLGMRAFGVHDNFLELGGNSLMAAQLITRLRAAFPVQLPLSALFEAPTVAGLTARLRTALGADSPTATALPPLRPVPRDGEPPPLSVVQARTLALEAADPGNPGLLMPFAIKLDGRLRLAALETAVDAVIRRHETLRTTFHRTADGWTQRIRATHPVAIPVLDLDGTGAERVALAQRLARKEAARPFDLARSPLRLRLLRLADDRHILLVTLHHVVCDTLSMVNFMQEVAANYRAGQPATPAPLAVQYADFAAWQRRLLDTGALDRQRASWRERLRDLPSPLPLPTDRPRASEHGIRSRQVPVGLSGDASERVLALGRQLGATPFVTLLAAYAALLGRVTGADDIVIGTPIGNRDHPGLEPLIGYVAHAVPLRIDLGGDPSFAELVTRTRETLLAAYAHPDLPYEDLVAETEPARDAERSRLFDAMFVLHSDLPQELSLPGMTWRLWAVPDMPAMFGATLGTLSLMLAESPAGLAGNLEYAEELFDATSARRLTDQFAVLVADGARRPEARLSELHLDVSPPPPPRADAAPWLPRLLAAAEARDEVALSGPDATMTWAELASHTTGVIGGDVTVRLDPAPSVRQLVGLLGALRAGRAVTLSGERWSDREVAGYLENLDETVDLGPGPVLTVEQSRTVRAALDLVAALCAGRAVRIAPRAAALTRLRWVPPADRDPRTLRFGVSYFANDEDSLAGPKYELLFDGVRLADELGLAAVWTPERHFHPFGGLYPSPTATSAALAAATTRIGIRAGSVVLPLHDPIRVAEDWAVIDNMSGGRVGVSFASGWHPDDFVLAPGQYASRRELMHEGIDTVRRLWRGEPVRRRNGVGEEIEVTIRPRPVQPELPFWLTAAGSPDTFRLAGELGGFVLTNLMAQTLDELAGKIALYREAWRAAGHDGSGHVTLMLHTFLADDPERAYAEAREPLLRYFRSSVGIARGFAVSQGLAIRPEDLSEDDLQSLVEHGLERYLQDGGLIGSPATCAPLVDRVRELGVDEVAALIDFGAPVEATLHGVELLAEVAERETARARAAADATVREAAERVTALAGWLADHRDGALLASPDLLALLADVAPDALAGRVVLAGDSAGDDGPAGIGSAGSAEALRRLVDAGVAVSVRHTLADGRWIAARAPTAGRDTVVTVRPAAGRGARVVDTAGRELGVGIVGELVLADRDRTGQRARWRPDGRLDLLPPPRPRTRPAAGTVTTDGIRPAGRDRPLPLSYAQQRLWYLDQLVPGNVAYNNAVALRMRGPLDADALHRALQEVVRRHEVLRTTIHPSKENDGAVQTIHPAVEIDLPIAQAVTDEVDRLAREHARQPFDLARGPLLHARLLRLAPHEHVLLIGMHHIVSDGWSAGVLLGELAALYQAFAAGEPSPLPPLPVQYADYAVWQRQQRHDEELAYWAETLAEVPMLELPADRPRGAVQSQRGARSPVHLGGELTVALQRLCRDTGVTPYMALHAALVTLLHRYSGQTDLAIGTAVAGRNRPETEQLVGCFINTVVVRADLAGDPTFHELLGRVKDATLGALAHQDIPFERLVDELHVSRALSHSPLFQAMFVLHNTPSPRVELGELTLEALDVDTGTAKLDLVLELREDGPAVGGAWEYNTDLFDAATVAQLTRHLLRLLADAAAHPDRRISELDLQADDERERVAALSTGPLLPASSEPASGTVAAAFEAQAARTPDARAVGDELTYRELDARANALAHRLRRDGVRPGDRVALLLERPADAITAMLAVVKAGGAYVPIDPHAPPARRDALIAQAAPVAVVTGLDTAGEPASPPASVAATDPAYVIFTSGSTGRPKGVVVEHGQLLWSTRARRAHYGPPGRCLNLYALTFDGSVAWIWYALLTGGTICCATPDVVAEPHALAELIARHEPQRVATVPALYGQLLAAASAHQLRSLRSVTVGGEACPPDLVRAHFELLPGTELHNEYGPTEATVWSTVHRLDGPVGGRVPIGRPIPGACNHVLDAHGRPVPAGAAGELHVGGPAVARGYLDEPDLTRERFVPDPFHDGRLYRTGDRVRWNRHGVLEFLGRMDRQVKVRGFRVEPAEIEAVLAAHSAVAEAAVVATGDRLVGYLAPATVGAGDVRAFAQARLPDYLVPGRLVTLPVLPRTRHGKLDLRALPAPDPAAASAHVEPRTEVERTLAAVVADVLRRPAVGVHDNFFELGGDSILAMSVVTRARQRAVEVTVRQLFQNPTVAGLATVAGTRLAVQAEQGTVAGPVPLTPVQRWFFAQEHPDPSHFNMSVQLELTHPVRPNVLQEALRAVLHHHDALRMRFTRHDGRWRQRNAPAEPGWTLETADASGDELAAHDQRLQESLNLTEGPLLRAALIRRGPDAPDRLLLVAHHLVTDGVSWRIALADLFTAYRQLDAGRPVELPPKTTSYAEWAHRLPEFTTGPDGRAELEYWTARPYHRAPRLPRDGDVPNVHAASRMVRTELGEADTAALTDVEHALLAAVSRAVARWTGSDHVQLDVERHGREDLVPGLDVTRTVGWFSDFHPVVLAVPPTDPLVAVAAQLRSVPNHGAGYVPLRYGLDDSPLHAVPPSELTVNYLGRLDAALPSDAPATVIGEVLGSLRAASTTRPYLIEITAGVLDGRLWLVWTYTDGIHHRATIDRLAADAMQTLRELGR